MTIERYTFGGVTHFSEGGKEYLSFTETVAPDSARVDIAVAGTLRSDARYELRDELMLCVAMKKDIYLDMDKLERISNSCMSVLLEIQQSIDQLGCGSLTLRALPKEIFRSLDSIGLTDLLMIEE
ncbi:MAG: STAS domain-containing protein [Oscillospiraceae bacterium]|nr:STAS domain-containing protein [Oscillospiraceae bacterium]